MKQFFAVLVLLVAGMINTFAQDQEFSKFYGSSNRAESFRSGVLANDSTFVMASHALEWNTVAGGYLDTGYIAVYQTKADTISYVKWSEPFTLVNNFSLSKVAGGYLVGYAQSGSWNNYYQVKVDKYNRFFEKESSKSIEKLIGINLCQKVVELDGSYYLYTLAYNDSSSTQLYVTKTDTALNEIWSRNYGSSGINKVVYDVIPSSDGKLIAVGYRSISGNQDWYALKIDTSGNVLWEKTYAFGPEDDIALNVHQIDSNKLLISGAWEPTAYHDRLRLLEVRLDNGNIIQTRIFEDILFDTLASFHNLQVLDDGYLFVTYKEPTYSKSVILGKMDKSYNPLWTKEYSYGLNGNYLYDIVIKPDGGILGCGSVVFQDEDLGPLNQQAWLLSLDSNGCLYPQYQCTYIDTADISGTTGITTLKNKEEINVYPNPTKNELQVSSPVPIQQIEVVNVMGTQVFLQKEIKQSNYRLNVESLPMGLYLLICTGENGTRSTLKFKKE